LGNGTFLLSIFYLFGTYLIRAFDYSSLKLLLRNI
jgi:hypothetical protein